MGKIKIHLEENTAKKILALLKQHIIDETNFEELLGLVSVYEEINEATGGKIKVAPPDKKKELFPDTPNLGLKLDDAKLNAVKPE